MNWNALIQVVLNIVEKNPQLLEDLITALMKLFAGNPAILTQAVTVAVAKVESTIPPKA